MDVVRFSAAVFLFALLTACVEKSEYDELKRKSEETAKRLAQTQEDLQKAREKIGEFQAHRYETFQNGFRRWRLDTVKGTSCVMLTTDQDWKNKETSRQSCTCEDLYANEAHFPSEETLRAFKCID